MSIQAVAWVLEHSEATLADRLVLIAIANHADARGWNAYPAVPLIAREALVSEATVYRALATLEESGELTVKRRAGRSNMYAITALGGSQIERGYPSQIERGPLANTQKRGRKLRPEPSITVNEPGAARIEYDPNTLEKDAEGRWFVRTTTATPKPIVADTKMPDELSEEARARGAEWLRALRRGGEP